MQAEFANQREYMERALDALKTRVGRTESQNASTSSAKVTGERAADHRVQRAAQGAAERCAQLIRRRTDLAADGRAQGPDWRGSARRRRRGLLRPSTAQSARSACQSRGVGGQKGLPRGTLLKGPRRRWAASVRVRRRC